MWSSITPPSFQQIFTFSVKENSPLEKKLKKNSRNELFWTARTLQSLDEICLWFKEEYNRPAVFMIPNYICYEVPAVFEKNNIEILTYNIDEHFSVDMASVQKVCQDKIPDFFLAVHFFGIASDLSNVKKWCTKNNSTLIEDSTHVPFPTDSIGNFGDISLYSPYKHFPVPNGGAVVIKDIYLEEHPALKKHFTDINQTIQLPLFWMIKKLIQTILKIQKHNPLQKHDEDPAMSTINLPYHGIYNYSLGILSHYSNEDLNNLISVRKENIENWERILSLIDYKSDVKNHGSLPMNFIYKSTHENTSEIFNQMNSLRIQPSTWPTLPDNSQLKERQLRESITVLPAHQGIKNNDFLKIINAIESKINFNLVIEVFNGSDAQWDQYLEKVADPNLLSSSAFINAKTKSTTELTERYILKNLSGEFQGIVSIRVKKIFLTKVYFVNRAPLMISSNPILHLNAIKVLRKKIKMRNLSFLFVAPEIENHAVVLKYMKQSSMIQLPFPLHHSSKIDLLKPLTELRSNLDSKWRNLLKKGEAFTSKVTVSQAENDFDYFLQMYKDFVKEKIFQGLSFDLLIHYFKNCDNAHKPLILFLKHDTKIISAVLVARYANEAIYLAGINDEEGRKACGNYVLLWKAIESLKSLGCHAFDLGGFDDINTPQITHFKRQMGGVEYKLAGTYLVLK